jgi:chorismate-pyruvate lyase
VNSPDPPILESQALIAIFLGDQPAALGRLESVESSALPDAARLLLDHNHHMTVTVERHHGGPVKVEVLREAWPDGVYAREILLRRTDGRAVLYGIVRIHLEAMPPAVRRQILLKEQPLGRILIAHELMRRVERMELLRIWPGPRLIELLGPPASAETSPESGCFFGRTALIHVDQQPAVELLEIVV